MNSNQLLSKLDALAERGFPKWVTYGLCGVTAAAALFLPPKFAFVLLPAATLGLAYVLPRQTWKRKSGFLAVLLCAGLVLSPSPAQAIG